MNKQFFQIHMDSKRIIQDPGMNWGTLYQVSPEEKEQLVQVLQGKQFHVVERHGCLGLHLSHVVRIRHWFLKDDPRYIPTISEKKWLIDKIEEVSKTNEFTGIAKSAYPTLLERLRSFPDIEDRLEYEIHYHY